MKRKEENRSIIAPSCTFSKPNKINCLPSNRVLDRKPDRVTGYKVLIDLTSLIYIYFIQKLPLYNGGKHHRGTNVCV